MKIYLYLANVNLVLKIKNLVLDFFGYTKSLNLAVLGWKVIILTLSTILTLLTILALLTILILSTILLLLIFLIILPLLIDIKLLIIKLLMIFSIKVSDTVI